MEPTYRAKDFPENDLSDRTGDFSDASIEAKVNFFMGLDAYSKVSEVEAKLEEYWNTKTATTLQTVAKRTAMPTAAAMAL